MTELRDDPRTIAHTSVAEDSMSVAVVGLGYVGLPSALALIAGSARVVGVDVSTDRLTRIRAMDVDLLPSDHARLRRALELHELTLTDDPAVISGADAVIICVPTPIDEHLTPDLRALSAACESVVSNARAGQTIVLTSTSYVGTTRDMLIAPLEERGMTIGTDVFVAFSPERIDPGNSSVSHDEVPRVVGGQTEECSARAAAVLALMTSRVHTVSSPEAAELTKLYENTFRAVNIALVNELADVSGVLDLQVTEVIDAAATKPYGFMPFAPGPGVGGHCIPCDPHYLLWQLRTHRVSMPLVESAMRDIAERPSRVVQRARDLLASRAIPTDSARVVVVGVSYKPGVEDVRESPALEIIERLQDLGVEVHYVDPYVPHVRVHGHELLGDSPDELIGRPPDLAVLHTRHPETGLEWLAGVPLVLDATYRAFDAPHRVAV
jgi:nucleotide sugar dehydrogenase